jgi:hypothetical protein
MFIRVSASSLKEVGLVAPIAFGSVCATTATYGETIAKTEHAERRMTPIALG